MAFGDTPSRMLIDATVAPYALGFCQGFTKRTFQVFSLAQYLHGGEPEQREARGGRAFFGRDRDARLYEKAA
ncbi:hypothetical protein Csa_005372 [Cucumis sativus]|nr:hypothetical protein Csa_005372 [Cucumis sativus]